MSESFDIIYFTKTLEFNQSLIQTIES